LEEDLLNHIKQKHNIKTTKKLIGKLTKRIEKKKNGTKLASAPIQEHVKVQKKQSEGQERISCEKCSKIYTIQSNLDRHMVEIHKKCCNHQFDSIDLIISHFNEKHSEKTSLSVMFSLFPMNNPMSISAISDNRMNISAICNDQDEDVIAELEEHNYSYIYVKSLIETEEKERTDVDSKITPKEKEDACPLCSTFFTLEWNRYVHAVRVHDACVLCNIKFSSQEIIIMHMMKHHQSKKCLIGERILRMENGNEKKIMQDLMKQVFQ
jgi:hypothetical protein